MAKEKQLGKKRKKVTSDNKKQLCFIKLINTLKSKADGHRAPTPQIDSLVNDLQNNRITCQTKIKDVVNASALPGPDKRAINKVVESTFRSAA